MCLSYRGAGTGARCGVKTAMDDDNKTEAFLLVVGSFLLSVIVAFWFFGYAALAIGHWSHPLWNGVCSFAAVVASVACGFVVARLVARACFRWWNVRVQLIPRSRWITGPILAAYLLTWIVAVPQVQSANTNWALGHKRTVTFQGMTLSYPEVCTYASVPVLPFVVASHHDYQVGPLWGWGGWDFQLWYGLGTCSIFRLTHWMS